MRLLRDGLVMVLLVWGSLASAQTQRVDSGLRVAEVTAYRRWMHEREQPVFTQFEPHRDQIRIDSIHTADDTARTLVVSLESGRHAVTVSGSNRAITVRSVPVIVAGTEHRGPWVTRDGVSLPTSHIGYVISVAPPPPTPTTWVDSIDHVVQDRGVRQSVSGIRVSWAVADSIVSGRRHRLIRDSAAVTYRERWTARDGEDSAIIERVATGFIRGRTLVDDSLGLAAWRADTTMLSGTATLSNSAIRMVLQTPARFEQYREWHLYTPRAYRELQDKRWDDLPPGVVRQPDAATVRMLDGDTLFRDSIQEALSTVVDPLQRFRLVELLSAFPGMEGRDLTREHFIALGDTALVFDHLGERDRAPRQFGEAAVRLIIAFLEDPGRLFAHGLPSELAWSGIAAELVARPPAIVADTADWPCTPAACRLLAAHWPSSRVPRLRLLGLLTRTMMDPARWDPVMRRQASEAPTFFASAMQLSEGTSRMSSAPIPSAGSDWRVWLQWMQSRTPRSALARRMASRRLEAPLFDEAHTLAYLQLRSGRNVRGEIELALAQARDDSARLVLGAIRDALTPPSLDEVAARFRSGQPVPMALARAQLQRFGSWITPSRLETTPADPRVALPLLDRLMAYRLAVNASVWRRIEVRTRRDSTAQDPESFIGLAIKPGTFFKVDNLPRELVEKWGARARTITTREWRRLPVSVTATVETFDRVLQAGPFVILEVSTSGQFPSPGDGRRHSWASGHRWILLEIDGEWFDVSDGNMTWIT